MTAIHVRDVWKMHHLILISAFSFLTSVYAQEVSTSFPPITDSGSLGSLKKSVNPFIHIGDRLKLPHLTTEDFEEVAISSDPMARAESNQTLATNSTSGNSREESTAISPPEIINIIGIIVLVVSIFCFVCTSCCWVSEKNFANFYDKWSEGRGENPPFKELRVFNYVVVIEPPDGNIDNSSTMAITTTKSTVDEDQKKSPEVIPLNQKKGKVNASSTQRKHDLSPTNRRL